MKPVDRTNSPRIMSLDVLRCIAVLLVICFHLDRSRIPGFLGRMLSPLMTGGWVGVDLFFVLSGFLVGGLLMAEYKKLGNIRARRFLIRRGLKIYPAFYVVITLTLITMRYLHLPIGPANVMHELLFVQNYGAVLWHHTWSLAVEEHFYLLLVILFTIALKTARDRRNALSFIPRAFAVVALSCLLLRIVAVFIARQSIYEVAIQTQYRLDSLFFGVLLGYYYHFYGESFNKYHCRPVVLC